MESTKTQAGASAKRTQKRDPGSVPLPGAEMSEKLVGRMARRYGVAPANLLQILRDTAFNPGKEKTKDGWKQAAPFTDSELAAALIIAEQYDLNPWAKEIAVVRSKGKLLVIVSIDGWIKIVNRQKTYRGLAPWRWEWDDKMQPVSCTCLMIVDGWAHPCEITEYFEECFRPSDRGDSPWNTHPRRMLRHKAYIQCARVAFGLSGIIDEDEASTLFELDDATPEASPRRAALDAPPVEHPELSKVREARSREKVPVEARLPERGSPMDTQYPDTSQPSGSVYEEEPREPGADEQEPLPPPAEASPTSSTSAELYMAWLEIKGRLTQEEVTRCRTSARIDFVNARVPAEQLQKLLAEAQAAVSMKGGA